MTHLRGAVRDAHERLEASLSLLSPLASRERFGTVLGRFHGFHAVWEPALRERAELHGLCVGRGRLGHLETDLAALGRSSDEISALPRCSAAADLCRTSRSALGSLYVVEGSTLGGKVIARALSEAAWAPEQGLAYFQGYGERNGRMWRALQDDLRAHDAAALDEIGAAAVATFDVLLSWMSCGDLAPEPRPAEPLDVSANAFA